VNWPGFFFVTVKTLFLSDADFAGMCVAGATLLVYSRPGGSRWNRRHRRRLMVWVLRSRTLEQRGGDMTHAPSIDPERRHAERLEIARKLYQALVAQDPGRVITLCDGGGEVVAQHDRRPDQSDLEIETRGGLTLQKNGPGDAPLGQ
jgi:hypothetical protein